MESCGRGKTRTEKGNVIITSGTSMDFILIWRGNLNLESLRDRMDYRVHAHACLQGSNEWDTARLRKFLEYGTVLITPVSIPRRSGMSKRYYSL